MNTELKNQNEELSLEELNAIAGGNGGKIAAKGDLDKGGLAGGIGFIGGGKGQSGSTNGLVGGGKKVG